MSVLSDAMEGLAISKLAELDLPQIPKITLPDLPKVTLPEFPKYDIPQVSPAIVEALKAASAVSAELQEAFKAANAVSASALKMAEFADLAMPKMASLEMVEALQAAKVANENVLQLSKLADPVTPAMAAAMHSFPDLSNVALPQFPELPEYTVAQYELRAPLIEAAPKITLPDSIVNPAKWTYERIVQLIIDFEAKLDDEHEIGARLVSFTDSETFHIENVGYWEPDMVIFYGRTPEGQPLELMQHVSKTNVLLVSVKKQKETEPARRIGFELAKGLQESS